MQLKIAGSFNKKEKDSFIFSHLIYEIIRA